MKSTTPKKDPGPLSVPLTPELRRRIAAQARKRKLKMATAARIFLDEHVRELEESVELSRAEEWQRAQAWASWERVRGGDRREVPLARLRAYAEAAKTKGTRTSR